MSQTADAPGMSAPGGARGVIRWICTKNPFYVISAGLFLAGLWISFGKQTQAEESWTLMAGLASYTLLLAATALLLVRFATVWEDVRTVLLLVVLMFLATSVTFDAALFLNPERGTALFIIGLLFAMAMSEGLLRGIRLRLPAWYRVPYYLILALFFLYPLALRPLQEDPRSEALMWGLFGFTSVAGLVFLTLLPAIRRGPDYVADNGSPWDWPLYPWTLFGVLAFAVPARSFLLCWSMQLLDFEDRERLIFGPYFLVPFGFAIAILLLEIGLVSSRRGVIGTALALPAGLMVLAMIGHRSDPLYRGFLDIFATRLGGDPLFITLLASIVFYVYAMARRVELATEALTAALALLAVVGPGSLDSGPLPVPEPLPLLLMAGLQLVLGVLWRSSWRCLLAGLLLGMASLALPAEIAESPWRWPITFHLALAVILMIGAFFDDFLAQLLRVVAAMLVMLACLTAMFAPLPFASYPAWLIEVYPLMMSLLLTAYFWWLRQHFTLVMAAGIATCWAVRLGLRGYIMLRLIVTGLDYIVLSLIVFSVAVLISLGKSGKLGWFTPASNELPPITPSETD